MPESVERIEGEFHYAELRTWKPYGRKRWVTFRKEDDEVLPGQFSNELAAEFRVGQLDAAANHFINLGAARERQRVNDLANRLRGFDAVRMKPVERSTTQYDFWQVEVAEAFGGTLTGDTFVDALESATATPEEDQ